MDVRKLVIALSLPLFLISCANETQKTPEKVFEKIQTDPCQSQAIEKSFVVQWEDGSYTTETGESADEFRQGFVKNNLTKIKKVYYDRKVNFLSQQELNGTQSAAPAKTAPDQFWGQKIVNADDAWSKGFKGQDIVVGVVDSYVDTSHSLLKNQILINEKEIPNNNIDDDDNGYVDDYMGMNFTNVSDYTIKNEHGTHVSGIIAAEHSTQMKGIAPKAKIVPAPFITNDGSGSLGDAIRAINYVVSRGAKVINASWGGSVCVSSLRDAFQNLSEKGVLIVVAAGNESQDLDFSPTYPAAFSADGQITVAASNENDFMASFSNSSFNLVHLAAPGDYIYSTTPNETYNYLRGTSMAAPFVTGTAAVLWSAVPTATAKQIKEAIINSVDIVTNHEYRVQSRGRLNIAKALSFLNK